MEHSSRFKRTCQTRSRDPFHRLEHFHSQIEDGRGWKAITRERSLYFAVDRWILQGLVLGSEKGKPTIKRIFQCPARPGAEPSPGQVAGQANNFWASEPPFPQKAPGQHVDLVVWSCGMFKSKIRLCVVCLFFLKKVPKLYKLMSPQNKY